MSRSIQTITKWVPLEIINYNDLFQSCKELQATALNLLHRVCKALTKLKARRACFSFFEKEFELQIQVCSITFITTQQYATQFFRTLKTLIQQ